MRRLIALCAVVVLLLAGCGGGDDDSSVGTSSGDTADVESAPSSTADEGDGTDVTPGGGPTTVTGPVLAPFQAGDDPTIGSEAPVAVGSDLLTGESITVAPADRPLAIAFFAHWCPHCQREVTELTEWLATNELPSGVDLVAISTIEDSSRDNHPPEDWLRREGWTHPIIPDTPDFGVAEAFGLSSVPYWVFVNADGTVALRIAGNLGPDQLAAIFTQLTG